MMLDAEFEGERMATGGNTAQEERAVNKAAAEILYSLRSTQ